jgi:hypothetical protein
MSKIVKRDESNLKIAGPGIIVLSGVCVFGSFISFAGLIVGLIAGNFNLGLLFLCMLLGLFTIGFVCDAIYEYQNGLEYELVDDGFIVRYNLERSLVPTNSPKVEIKCKDIVNINVTKNQIKLKGNFTKNVPFRRNILITHYELPLKDFTEEDLTVIKDHCKTIADNIIKK